MHAARRREKSRQQVDAQMHVVPAGCNRPEHCRPEHQEPQGFIGPGETAAEAHPQQHLGRCQADHGEQDDAEQHILQPAPKALGAPAGLARRSATLLTD